MRIAIQIAEVMVPAIHGAPNERRALYSQSAHRHPEGSETTVRFKRVMRQQAVKTDGDAPFREHDADDEQGQVGPTHPTDLPKQHHRGDHADKGQNHHQQHGDDVRRLPP